MEPTSSHQDPCLRAPSEKKASPSLTAESTSAPAKTDHPHQAGSGSQTQIGTASQRSTHPAENIYPDTYSLYTDKYGLFGPSSAIYTGRPERRYKGFRAQFEKNMTLIQDALSASKRASLRKLGAVKSTIDSLEKSGISYLDIVRLDENYRLWKQALKGNSDFQIPEIPEGSLDDPNWTPASTRPSPSGLGNHYTAMLVRESEVKRLANLAEENREAIRIVMRTMPVSIRKRQDGTEDVGYLDLLIDDCWSMQQEIETTLRDALEAFNDFRGNAKTNHNLRAGGDSKEVAPDIQPRPKLQFPKLDELQDSIGRHSGYEAQTLRLSAGTDQGNQRSGAYDLGTSQQAAAAMTDSQEADEHRHKFNSTYPGETHDVPEDVRSQPETNVGDENNVTTTPNDFNPQERNHSLQQENTKSPSILGHMHHKYIIGTQAELNSQQESGPVDSEENFDTEGVSGPQHDKDFLDQPIMHNNIEEALYEAISETIRSSPAMVQSKAIGDKQQDTNPSPGNGAVRQDRQSGSTVDGTVGQTGGIGQNVSALPVQAFNSNPRISSSLPPRIQLRWKGMRPFLDGRSTDLNEMSDVGVD